MPLTLGELATAAITGGVGGKAFDLLLEQWKLFAGEKRTARKVVEQQLDPILKSADEIVGRVRSLALEDFKSLGPRARGSDLERMETMFLFAQFWGRLQILRIESEFVVLGATSKGRKLQAFIRALESTRLRLVDRMRQRAIGEALISQGNPARSLGFNEFLEKRAAEPLRQLLEPLEVVLMNAHHTANRQKVLSYGAVLHSLIDHLDPRHRVTRLRTGWGNKLSSRSSRELFFRAFGVYLPLVRNPGRYTRRRQKELSARKALANHQASDTLLGRLLEQLAHRLPARVRKSVARLSCLVA